MSEIDRIFREQDELLTAWRYNTVKMIFLGFNALLFFNWVIWLILLENDLIVSVLSALAFIVSVFLYQKQAKVLGVIVNVQWSAVTTPPIVIMLGLLSFF